MKNIWWMMMAVVSVLFLWSSCSAGEAIDDESPVVPARVAIGFANGSVSSSVTVRGITPLEDHHSTMGVWGWETATDGTDNMLFRNQEVDFDSLKNDWIYSPVKYWINECQYRFYAYAPYNTAATITAENGQMSIHNVHLTGVNLQGVASDSLKESFFGTADTDWMVAREGVSVPGTYRYKVKFFMQHILSKFVVTMRKSDALAADSNVTKVVLNSMTIGAWASKGDFDQKLNHTPVPTDSADLATCEWTLDSAAVRYTLAMTESCEVDKTEKYIFESLALPQTITDDMCVKMRYTMTFSDGREEHYLYTLKMNEAFDVLCAGNCYKLHFIISPDCIRFDSGVDEWSSRQTGGGNI